MAYIPLEPVVSSMIAKIGYDRKTQTLRVVFENGDAYDYPTFTERDWEAFRAAESLGRHFHRAIRPMFGHRRVAENQLQEPCCDHPDRDTCDDSCLPCDPACCLGLSVAERRQRLLALAEGQARGQQLIEAARVGDADAAGGGVCEHVNLDSDMDGTHSVCLDCWVEFDLCSHANRESTSDGTIVGCADCGADLSPTPEEGADGTED